MGYSSDEDFKVRDIGRDGERVAGRMDGEMDE